MRADVTIEQLGAGYALKARSHLGRKYLRSLPASYSGLCDGVLVVDELPHRMHCYVHIWHVHRGGKK